MIYFIREGEYPDTRVKIGYTVKSDLSKRMGALQIGNPNELSECWVIPGDMEVEKLIHSFFKPYRIRGEWFKEDCWYDILWGYFTGNIQAIVENYTTPIDGSLTSERTWDNNDDGDECIPEIKYWLKSEVNVVANSTGGFDRKAYQRDLMRKRRGESEQISCSEQV